MTAPIDTSRLPPHLTLSGGWKPKGPNGTIRGPLEEFSSTMLSKFECPRAGAFSYIHGIKEQFSSKEAANGIEGHEQLDGFYSGRPLKFNDPNPNTRWIAERVLPATLYMPRSDQCDEVYRESKDWLDTSAICPDLEPLKIQVKKDLEFRVGSEWFTYDYKTVNSWDRMLTRNQLMGDIQGILYPLDTMIRRRTARVNSLWIYINMNPELPPEARPLDAQFHFEDSRLRAEPIVRHADKIRKLIRLRVHPNDLEPNPHKCLEYYSEKKERETGKPTGCPYRCKVGGPCDYTGPMYRSFEKKEANYMTTQAQFPSFDFATPSPGAPPTFAFPVAPQNAPSIVMPSVPFAPPEAAAFPIAAPPPPPPPPPAPVLPAGMVQIPVPQGAPPMPPGTSWFLNAGTWNPAPTPAGFADGAFQVAPSATPTPVAAAPAPVVPEPPASATEKKPRKPRATKAEMEARRAAEGAAPSVTPSADAAPYGAVQTDLPTEADVQSMQLFIRIVQANGFTFETPVSDPRYVEPLTQFARDKMRDQLGGE